MRFKIWHNDSEVTLTIHEGEEINIGAAGPTDEGYFRWSDCYTLEDGVLFCERERSERDCDGRLDTHDMYVADSFTLDRFPAWRRISARQRDYEAERAGY